MHRSALNPMKVHIVGAKQLPSLSESKYLPVYVKVKFFNEEFARTQDVPHNSTCKWKFKHVFLLGKIDPVWLKEKLSKEVLKFELHDKDQLNKNEVKEAIELIEIDEKKEEESEEEDPKAKKKKGKAASKSKKKPDKKKEEKVDVAPPES